MPDPIKEQSPTAENKYAKDTILGNKNPKKMTEAEFFTSPDLLFHGSANPLVYKVSFDYQGEENHMNEGSQTLGVGFYVTPQKEAAQGFAKRKEVGFTSSLAEVLPYEAKMLDFRSESGGNSFVPRKLFDEWFNFQKKHRKTDYILSQLNQEYYFFLCELKRNPTLDFTLRQMLSTEKIPDMPRSKEMDTPPSTFQFPKFMIEHGYDGVIDRGGKNASIQYDSFVFYNLYKAGTYQSWQERR